MTVNLRAIFAIYSFEMNRAFRTIGQTFASPVVTTMLYFVVFGAAIGSRMGAVEGVPYGAFIVPGLIMLSILPMSVANGSFGIYIPRFSGTIYEVLSAPLSPIEIVVGYAGASATKSVLVGLIILATSYLFVPIEIQHPGMMLLFLVLTSVTFSLFGFIVGIWADGFEKLSMLPSLVITPLSFLGGIFYSISMLPPFWQTVSHYNPVAYLISGFRWSFFGTSHFGVEVALAVTLVFLVGQLGIITWIFRTGYRIKP